MNHNPDSKVKDAHDIAKKWGNGIEQVIIIGIDGDGNYTYASFGETVKLCGVADKLAQAAIEGIANYVQLLEVVSVALTASPSPTVASEANCPRWHGGCDSDLGGTCPTGATCPASQGAERKGTL